MTTTAGSASERIAGNVRAIMGKKKLTVAALARRSNIPERTMYRLRNGERRWEAEEIEAVAFALGVDWPALVSTDSEVAA